MESSLFFLVAVIAGGLFLLWMILYFIPVSYTHLTLPTKA